MNDKYAIDINPMLHYDMHLLIGVWASVGDCLLNMISLR